MDGYGIMFHHFHGGRHPASQGSITQAQFEQIIQTYQRRLLSAQDWADRVLTGKLKDEICITFDDNLRCQFDIAYPVLTKYQLTAFWFIPTGIFTGQLDLMEVYRMFRNVQFKSIDQFYDEFFAAADHEQILRDFKPAEYLIQYPFYTDNDRRFRYLRDEIMSVAAYNSVMNQLLEKHNVSATAMAEQLWMQERQLQELHANGHLIGLHSHSHPMSLKKLTAGQQRLEYQTNKQVVTKVIGVPPFTVSHPCGSYNDDTLGILSAMGITLGFRDDMTSGSTLLELPRQDHANIIKQLSL